MPFYGSFDYQLDDRNRVPIPPKFRDAFEGGAVLATGMEPCVLLYTEDGFTKAGESIESIPAELEQGRDARREFYANSYAVQKDSQGRVLLNQKMVSWAGLTKDVLVVGVGDWVEVWDKTEWANREAARAAARKAAMAAVGERKSAQPGAGK